MRQLTQVQSWRSAKNLVPLPYRRVSVQHYDGPMTVDAITALLLRLLHQSFNMMTLGGMAAAVGLIIDDGIVMSEHIVRRLRARGEAP